MTLAEEAAEEIEEYREREASGELSETELIELQEDMRSRIRDLFLDEEWELSDRIIQEEVQQALGWEFPGEGDPEEYFEEVVEDLKSETRYTAYVYFSRISEIPVGTEIGDLEIIERPEEEERVVEFVDRLFEDEVLYEGRNWGQIEYTSLRERAFIDEEVVDVLQRPLSILKIALGNVSPPEDLAVAVLSESGRGLYLKPKHEPRSRTRYLEDMAQPVLSDLSEMAKKDENELTPLERNILGSLRLLTLHNTDYRNEHSFLALISVLEGLLVRKYESPKGSKIAEKTVQLLHRSDSHIDERVANYDRIKGWYNTRSEIIHGGQHGRIDDEEIWALDSTVMEVTRALVKLTGEYYALQKQGGENNPYKGLNELFLELRLSTVLDDQ